MKEVIRVYDKFKSVRLYKEGSYYFILVNRRYIEI